MRCSNDNRDRRIAGGLSGVFAVTLFLLMAQFQLGAGLPFGA